jgi:hypothetical protein
MHDGERAKSFTTRRAILRSGYFENLKSGPKVVFWGNQRAMNELAGILRACSVGTGALSLDSFSEAVDGRTILIKTVSPPVGMRARANGFDWALDADTMTNFADMIAVLAESCEPGHQYLECGASGEIVVMASCGEFPGDLRP